MNIQKLIFRFISSDTWSVRDGLSVKLPEGTDDDRALDVQYVYWTDEKRNGDAHDPGGVLLKVIEWSKTITEGSAIWTVTFGAAVKAPGILSTIFSKDEIVLERGSKDFFERGDIIDLTNLKPAHHGDFILPIDSAKDAMSRYYGIGSEFITVKIEK